MQCDFFMNKSLAVVVASNVGTMYSVEILSNNVGNNDAISKSKLNNVK